MGFSWARGRGKGEERGRRGPDVERLEMVRDQLYGTTDYYSSFELSSCRLLTH
jgi:hypothetical protein